MHIILLFASLCGVSGFGSSQSTFTRTLSTRIASRLHGKMVMYDYNKDPPSSRGDTNMWSVLATTEKWISTILGKSDASNPYTRKEVTYLCELSDEDALIVAGIWRLLKESREQGVVHGRTEEHRLVDHKGEPYDPPTFRRTNVIVVPNDSNLRDFAVFDNLVNKINSCRRNARDFILDVNLEKIEKNSNEREWSVSVNCAHLHPDFGYPSDDTSDNEQEEEENIKLYKQKRLLARRSPYPTICIEVRATPPPDFGEASPFSTTSDTRAVVTEEDRITSADVMKLEALFGKAATFSKESSSEDLFWNSLGETGGLTELSLASPLVQAQNWIAKNHAIFDITTSTFTSTDCQEVDEAYEFAFTNLAMKSNTIDTQYLVYSNFMSSSATSFEKFAVEVNDLLKLMPSLEGKVRVSAMHPEHINPANRSPVAVLVMVWAI